MRLRIVDIDGTIVDAQGEPFPRAVEKVREWLHRGNHVIFWTARFEHTRAETVAMLKKLRLDGYAALLMGKDPAVDIYDDGIILTTVHKHDYREGLQC